MAQFLIGRDSPVTQGHLLVICHVSVTQTRAQWRKRKRERKYSGKGEQMIDIGSFDLSAI